METYHQFFLKLDPLDYRRQESATKAIEQLKALDELASKLGVHFHVMGEGRDATIRLVCDEKQMEKAATRRAGKKRHYFWYHDDVVTTKQINDMMQTMTQKEIMKELNIPERTFYRHLDKMRAAENSGFPNKYF